MEEDKKIVDMAHLHEKERDVQFVKREEKEYWFRIRNDGRCPEDAMPFKMEYESYKLWAESIQDGALD